MVVPASMAKLSAESGVNCCRVANSFIWICVFILVLLPDVDVEDYIQHFRHFSYISQVLVMDFAKNKKEQHEPLPSGIIFLFAAD